MSVFDSINELYYNLTICELKSMNNKVYGGLTHNSLLYLDLISYKEDCTVSFLAESLNVTKSAVTIKVNELIEKGFVVKKQSEKDKRVNYIYINEKLEKEYKEYDRLLYKISGALENEYTKEETELFEKMLNSLSSEFMKSSKNL